MVSKDIRAMPWHILASMSGFIKWICERSRANFFFHTGALLLLCLPLKSARTKWASFKREKKKRVSVEGGACWWVVFAQQNLIWASWRRFSSGANSLKTHPSLGDGWEDKGGLPPRLSPTHSHTLTHVQSAVTHTDINSCKHTHRHAHIHTSAVRQSPPCLTTTEEGGGSWAEEELKGTERYTISKWMD